MQPSMFTRPSASSSSRHHQPFASREPGVSRTESYPSHERDDSWIEVSSQPSDDTYSSPDDHVLNLGPSRDRLRRKRKLRRTEVLQGKSFSKVFDNSADDLSEAEIIGGSSGSGSPVDVHEDFESSSSAAGEEEDSNEEGEIEEEEDTGTMLGIGYRNDQRNLDRVPGRHTTSSVHQFHRSLQSNPSYSFLRHRNSHSSGSSGRCLQTCTETKADHDQALMASLSTLLSCAAAARGLPKVSHQGTSSPRGPSRVPTVSSSRVQLDTLQLVPDQAMVEKSSAAEARFGEGQVNTPAGALPPNHISRPRQRTSTTSSLGSRDSSKRRLAEPEESKKRSLSGGGGGNGRTRSSSPRSTHRLSKLTSTLSSTDASILTLAVSAGAVIILSAISFSAGYVLGREIGKTEAEAALSVVGRTGSVAQRGGRGLVGGVGRVVSVSA